MTPSMNSRDLLVSREKPSTGGVVKPLAIDLCCGLGGWTEGLLAEGWRVRGYDIEAHEYGDERYPAELVLKSILDLHGSELADADLIVASPPCQEFSYMAMPWTRARQIARALRGEDEFPPDYKGSRTLAELTALFDACFRLQREASEAAGRQIPMVVENVKGAQPWVGRAPWSFGSYFLWGDIPALMPSAAKTGVKVGGMGWYPPDDPRHQIGAAFNPAAQGAAFAAAREGRKNPGFRFDGSGKSFQTESVKQHLEGTKNTGGSWFNIGSPGQKETGKNPVHAYVAEGLKAPGGPHRRDGAPHTKRLTNPAEHLKPPARVSAEPPDAGRKGKGSGAEWFDQNISSLPSGSKRRKAASAQIAKIPAALSQHIARVYRPDPARAAA